MFLFETLSFLCTILIAILLFKLKSYKLNADSSLKQLLDLQSQLTVDRNTYEDREQKLHETITGLRQVLSEEQQIIKTKELDLKNQESELLKNIAEVLDRSESRVKEYLKSK